MDLQNALAYSRIKQIKNNRHNSDKEMIKVEHILGYKPVVKNRSKVKAIDILMEFHKAL